MELEFDNEIDALLRKEAGLRTITIGEFAGVHLDADEIAAFVENAVPERTRSTFMKHFAGCDPCRKALSHAARLYGEAPELSERIVAPVVGTSVPWYRRLFLFPNLAYVMGGLVVVFAGFIGLSVYNSSRGGQFEVSKAVSSEPAAVDTQPNYAANSNAMSEAVANTASNAISNASNSSANSAGADDGLSVPSANSSGDGVAPQKGTHSSADADEMRGAPVPPPAAPAASPSKGKDSGFVTDGVDSKSVEKLPINGRRTQDLRLEPNKERAKAEEQKAPLKMTPSTENSRNAQMSQNAVKPKAPPVQRSDSRVNEQRSVQPPRDREADTALAKKKTDKAPVGAGTFSSPQKQVSGKTFVFRQGAWYDTVYNGQGTINVRRKTDNYKKLDSGLRGIAESILGTVVTVWNGKAYRID
ncbi:MAG: hypothetical protein HOP17_00525 [Acidobacteria bacterium]|nr:hypothetical protein [Acidobacteriota bacterium]